MTWDINTGDAYVTVRSSPPKVHLRVNQRYENTGLAMMDADDVRKLIDTLEDALEEIEDGV